MIDGHVNQLASEFERVNATNEECKEMCNNDTTCVSFEFCHYWCDEELGPPSKNHCIINYKNFPQSAMPQSFFRCSKGKKYTVLLLATYVQLKTKKGNSLALYHFFRLSRPIFKSRSFVL